MSFFSHTKNERLPHGKEDECEIVPVPQQSLLLLFEHSSYSL